MQNIHQVHYVDLVSFELLSKYSNQSDCTFRHAGKAFVILLKDTNANRANELAQDMLNEIRTSQWDAQDISISACAGIAQMNKQQSAHHWLTNGIRALKRAKLHGPGSLVCHDD